MTNIKDNQIHPEHKGHASSADVMGQKNSHKQRSDVIVRKAEKLTTALYMVSDIITDREPIKWKMRETSVELLSDITLSASASPAERLSFLRNVIKRIEKIVSFLDIAWVTRMVSEMNATLLRNEYIALRNMIEEDVLVLLEGNAFKELPPQPMYRLRPVEKKTYTPTEHDSGDSSNLGTPKSKELTVPIGHSISEKHADHIPASLPAVSEEGGVVPTAPRVKIVDDANLRSISLTSDSRIAKDDRRKIIFALLKQKPELTVKDITKSIPGFSEKTIQRELIAMLEEGLLVKRGEKRWTTYALA